MSQLLVTNNNNPTSINRIAIRTKPLDARGDTLEDYTAVGSQISTPKKAKVLQPAPKVGQTARQYAAGLLTVTGTKVAQGPDSDVHCLKQGVLQRA